MTFYSIVCELNLGEWHELFALHINPNEINCVTFLQKKLNMSAMTMKTVLGDFIDLGLGKLNKKNAELFEIDVDMIILICQKMTENSFAQKVDLNSLMTTQQIRLN